MTVTSRWISKTLSAHHLPGDKRSILASQWGILFAIIAILATTLLSWQDLAAQDSSNGILNSSSVVPNSKAALKTSTQARMVDATEAQNRIAKLDFEDIDFNRGWRKGKSGWVQIQKYHVESQVELNLIQKISPVFWAVTLWMFAIVLLVLAG